MFSTSKLVSAKKRKKARQMMIETKETPARNQVSNIQKPVCPCLQGLEHSLYYRNRSGHVFPDIASQKFSGETAIQKNLNEIRENLKNPSHV